MKIVFLDEGTLFNASNLSLLKKYGEYIGYHHTPYEQVSERLKGVAIAITNKVVIDRAAINACPHLKLICVAATGMNNIDLKAADENNIMVKNVTGYSTNSVVQVAWGMILHLINHVNYYNNYVKSGQYSKNDFFTHLEKPIWELQGKKMGILGLGTIGRQMAKVAIAYGMQVYYTSLSGTKRIEPYMELPLDELLSTCDIVSIHSPLNDFSKNLINIHKLKLMPKHALLINVARGGIVVESDLAQALTQGIIAGAGLDVFNSEPIEGNNPLLSPEISDKVVLAPHIAWGSVEARTRLINGIASNIESYLSEYQF